MGAFLKILTGMLTCLTLVSCAPSKTEKAPKVATNTPIAIEQKGSCRFDGETADTSLEQHFENINQALNGPELSKYFISCGSFVGADRYYSDMLTPAALITLKEIRANRKFKALSYQTLVSSNATNPDYLDLIAVNGNWKNDIRIGTYLIRLLNAADHDTRMAAAGALKGATSPVIIERLVRMTKSPNALSRFVSAVALENTKVPAGRRALRELQNDSDSGVRTQAMLGMM